MSDEPIHTRSAVVGDREAANNLNAGGVPSVTFEAVLGASDARLQEFFRDDTAALFVRADTEHVAQAAQDRLQSLRVRVSWYRVIERRRLR